MAIKLTGDWRKLRAFLQDTTLFESMNQIIKRKAEEIKEAIQQAIPYDDVPNAETTIAHKGYDAPLFESGNLEANIVIKEEARGVSAGTVYTYHIQGNPDKLVSNPDRSNDEHGGITYADLLFILNEVTMNSGYGNQTIIPARPILDETWLKMKYAGLEHGIELDFEEEVRKRLR